MGHGSDHGHGAEWTDRPGNYQQGLPAGKWNKCVIGRTVEAQAPNSQAFPSGPGVCEKEVFGFCLFLAFGLIIRFGFPCCYRLRCHVASSMYLT